jgi:two-component sensor histidine kinase
MFKKWKSISPFKNGKKIAAVVSLILFLGGNYLPLQAQEIEYGREINEFNGLISNVTRVTFTDDNGAVWVGTDAGLNVFPLHTKAQSDICNRTASSQIWGIAQLSQHLYVATFDSGLFKFDLNQGKLLKRWNPEEMPRIRRLRKINEQLYVVHGNGVTQISPNIDRPLFKLPLEGMEWPDFPMDVYTISGRLHVSFYETNAPYTLTQDGRWIASTLFTGDKDSLNHQHVICAKEINGKTYIGVFPDKYIVYEQGKYEVYRFTFNREKQLALWDVDGINEHVYFAIGNNLDMNDGYFWKHDPEGPKNIHLRLVDQRKYAWGVTVDPYYNGVWFSTITHGTYFQPHKEHWIRVPEDYQDLRITSNYIVVWNSFFAYVRERKGTQWRKIPISSAIIDLIELNGVLYIINNQEFISYSNHKTRGKITHIIKEHYQSMALHEGNIYLFRLFGMGDFYDVKKQKIYKSYNKEIDRVIRFAQNRNNLLLHIENKGYALVENQKLIPLKTDLKSDIIKNRFFFCGNHLITQIGSEIRVSTVNKMSKTITTHSHVDLKMLFPGISIEWVNAANQSLWLGNSTLAFEFKINPKSNELIYKGQFYLGQSPLSFESIQLTESFLYKKGKGEIMQISILPENAIDFKPETQIKLNGSDLNFNTITTRSWVGQTLALNTQSNHYFYENYGRQPIEIWDYKELLEKKFISVSSPYILDNFPHGVYNLHVGPANGIAYNLLFRINQTIFYNVGFWIIFIITLLLLGFVVFQYQREKLSLNQKIVSLQLSTLKANLNPHFIFNIMNLIQSLIVKSEKNKALKATSELANLNRLFLETSNKDLITVEEELDFASKYINLEKMRFEEDARINFDIQIDKGIDIKEWFLPPLILQPLLENALKHGFFSDKAPETTITLKVSNLEPHQLHINITNPLIKRKGRKPLGTNLGISLVEDRLALLNERYHFDYHASFKAYNNLTGLFVAAITIEKRNIAWMYHKPLS